MSTTTQAPELVTVTAIDRDAFRFDELRDGEGLGVAAAGLTEGQTVNGEGSENAMLAWEKGVVDVAIEEVLPQIRDLIAGAIEKRLPWTWPG
jgi:hypothetical protein